MKHACRQASRLASDSIDRKLSILERLKFHLHLAICKNCRNCDNSFRLVHQTTKLMRKTRYGDARLSDSQRQQLHKAIDEQLAP
ncbi:Putative zinc-finger [Mariprofundus ferrinatatus]|uniref:Zinc-finger n=1 Tax=Mariprofundus ferrinatatus TaxID=1921087 RepID=A0A2K8L2U8_9PROT|nr:zf-HC2 domain-containing protein [Mariprofundus ferrinatatus]ATX81655.1 Putative zinc-finger [Mariprofundus ferrinatatus]